jgi:hypothetical protein
MEQVHNLTGHDIPHDIPSEKNILSASEANEIADLLGCMTSDTLDLMNILGQLISLTSLIQQRAMFPAISNIGVSPNDNCNNMLQQMVDIAGEYAWKAENAMWGFTEYHESSGNLPPMSYHVYEAWSSLEDKLSALDAATCAPTDLHDIHVCIVQLHRSLIEMMLKVEAWVTRSRLLHKKRKLYVQSSQVENSMNQNELERCCKRRKFCA